MEDKTKEEENEIDIDEIEAILGLEGKEKEISELFSNKYPHSFLEGISLITNSNKFNDNSQIKKDNDIFPEFKDVIINCSNFYMAENYDRLKILFPNPEKIKENKESKKLNENKENKNIENVNNDIKNNMNKKKKKKKKKEKKRRKENKRRK